MNVPKQLFLCSIPLILLLTEASTINYCPKKCNKCLKQDLTNCTLTANNELSIELYPKEIVISCGNFSTKNNQDVIGFDAHYLTEIDDLASMIRKCYKTKAKKNKYLIDNIKRISLTNDIFNFNKSIDYFQYSQSPSINKTTVDIENNFFKTATNLKTIIMINSQITKLNFDRFPDIIEYLTLASNEIENVEQGNNSLENLISLDLSENKLPNITKNYFVKIRNLKYLNLSKNEINSIDFDSFKNNQVLEELDLSQNPLDNLDFYLPDLKKLDLNGCNLTILSSKIFPKSYNLNYLDMSNNRIYHLETETFSKMPNLTSINLSYNFLQSLTFSDRLFENNKNLKTVNLSYNKLMVIFTDMFVGAQELDTLDLSYNEICNFSNNLQGFKAKNLNFKHNKIDDFPSDLIYDSAVQTLDMSYNEIKIVSLVREDVPEDQYFEVYLRHNEINQLNITNNDAPKNWTIMMDLSQNQLKCDCLGYFLKQIPQSDHQITITNITSQEIICYNSYPDNNCPLISIENCPTKCHCSYSRIHNSIIVDCSNRNLVRFPYIKNLLTDRYKQNQTFVMLSGNKLDLNGQDLLETYSDVTRLNLTDNRISELKWLPENLTILDLTNNSLTTLAPEIIARLEKNNNLKRVSMKNNPWKCDCQALDFREYLMNHEKIFEKSEIICHDTLRQLIYTELCDHTVGIVMGVTTTIAFIFVVLSALYFKYTDTIKVYLYSKNLCLWWVAEEEIDKDKTYDVFISYSHRDEELVRNELLPELENGEPPFKVCYHHRDWLPGEFITTQIANSVLDSRRTIVILSNSFMDSVWGKMEFRAAHTQAITDGRVRVIVVIYGELDESNLGDEMNMYLKTNTYIKWGDPWFWNKLKYALPHSKHRGRHQVPLEVVSSQESFHLR
ncbi:unnamed protein product [Ceutorhynchus assimilis]|uniref:TIR domain-containing protein n=1 Tax=Ceutorhynchus assimilis TaxID=467358 RepID=A0A9N9QPV9_9CUCU|nr:unnamed protein product [Ceutorhynchus assimilis]